MVATKINYYEQEKLRDVQLESNGILDFKVYRSIVNFDTRLREIDRKILKFISACSIKNAKNKIGFYALLDPTRLCKKFHLYTKVNKYYDKSKVKNVLAKLRKLNYVLFFKYGNKSCYYPNMKMLNPKSSSFNPFLVQNNTTFKHDLNQFLPLDNDQNEEISNAYINNKFIILNSNNNSSSSIESVKQKNSVVKVNEKKVKNKNTTKQKSLTKKNSQDEFIFEQNDKKNSFVQDSEQNVQQKKSNQYEQIQKRQNDENESKEESRKQQLKEDTEYQYMIRAFKDMKISKKENYNLFEKWASLDDFSLLKKAVDICHGKYISGEDISFYDIDQQCQKIPETPLMMSDKDWERSKEISLTEHGIHLLKSEFFNINISNYYKREREIRNRIVRIIRHIWKHIHIDQKPLYSNVYGFAKKLANKYTNVNFSETISFFCQQPKQANLTEYDHQTQVKIEMQNERELDNLVKQRLDEMSKEEYNYYYEKAKRMTPLKSDELIKSFAEGILRSELEETLGKNHENKKV